MLTMLICVLAGTVLMLVAVWVGWATAADQSALLVRPVRWWLTNAILPHLASRSWLRRAASIAINNLLILAGLIALGRWLIAVLAGIAMCGVAMGIALRILPELPGGVDFSAVAKAPRKRRRMRLGLILNLLEPPAIALTLGLAIGRAVIPVSTACIWSTFAVWVVPPMLIAAGGEALWLGVLAEGAEPGDQDDSPPDPGAGGPASTDQ